MSNLEIRGAIAGAGLKHWQVAAAIKMDESVFSRKLRKELSIEEKQKVLDAIKQLAENKRAEAAHV